MTRNEMEKSCDICGKDNEPIHYECCGVKICFPCDGRFAGLCSVCQRDELNSEMFCECCAKTRKYDDNIVLPLL